MNADRISELVIEGAAQEFKGTDFRDLLKPGVYVLIERGTVLYVGIGSRLLRRIAGDHHKNDLLERCDKVLLYPCVSFEAAQELERLLIFRLKPLHNTQQRYTPLTRLMGIARSSSASSYIPQELNV